MKKTLFAESLITNTKTYKDYYNRLLNLALARIQWEGMPDTIDLRYLERRLTCHGNIVYFRDEVIGDLALPAVLSGRVSVYDVPISRHIETANGYHADRTIKDSVIIYNNLARTPDTDTLRQFAYRMAMLTRIIDVNTNAQKTPVLITGPQEYKLTLANLYKEYDGNAPVIQGYKKLDTCQFTVLKTDSPYVSDRLYELRVQYWNEALTFLGIPNTSFMKRERMVSDEVARMQGGAIASRLSYLKARNQAADQINRMFGTSIHANFDDELLAALAAETVREDLDNEQVHD